MFKLFNPLPHDIHSEMIRVSEASPWNPGVQGGTGQLVLLVGELIRLTNQAEIFRVGSGGLEWSKNVVPKGAPRAN